MRHVTALIALCALWAAGAPAGAAQALEVQLPAAPDVQLPPAPDVEETVKTTKETVDDTVESSPVGGSAPAPGAVSGSGPGSASGGSAEEGSGSGGTSTSSGGSTAGSGSGGRERSESERESASFGALVAGERDKCPLDRRGDGAVLAAAGGRDGDRASATPEAADGGRVALPAFPRADGAPSEGRFPGTSADDGTAGPVLTALLFGTALALGLLALAGGLASGARRLRERY